MGIDVNILDEILSSHLSLSLLEISSSRLADLPSCFLFFLPSFYLLSFVNPFAPEFKKKKKTAKEAGDTASLFLELGLKDTIDLFYPKFEC